MSPSTASDANRSDAPAPVVTDAATQSERMPPTRASISLGVEPGGINPHSWGPARTSSKTETAPPASRMAPSSQWPFVHASTVNPRATRPTPAARPRRPSARTMTEAPAQAAKAPAAVTKVSATRSSARDREGQGDQRRQPQQRATSGRGRLQRAQVDQRAVLIGDGGGAQLRADATEQLSGGQGEQRRARLHAHQRRARADVSEHSEKQHWCEQRQSRQDSRDRHD